MAWLILSILIIYVEKAAGCALSPCLSVSAVGIFNPSNPKETHLGYQHSQAEQCCPRSPLVPLKTTPATPKSTPSGQEGAFGGVLASAGGVVHHFFSFFFRKLKTPHFFFTLWVVSGKGRAGGGKGREGEGRRDLFYFFLARLTFVFFFSLPHPPKLSVAAEVTPPRPRQPGRAWAAAAPRRRPPGNGGGAGPCPRPGVPPLYNAFM